MALSLIFEQENYENGNGSRYESIIVFYN